MEDDLKIEQFMTAEMLEELTNGLEPGENPNSLKFKIKTALGTLSTAVTQKFTNSSLAEFTLISPNCTTPRNHNIDTITPHHAAGVLPVKTLMEWFSRPSTRASCTYGIGADGKIARGLPESARPWTSSSAANDNRAITWEICDAGWEKDGWPISEASFEAAVKLAVDICRRYGKKKLIYIKDRDKALAYEPKADEMKLTRHEWFANTCCPGPGLGARFEELAARVTAELNNTNYEEEEDMQRFKTIEELPKYYRADVQKLVEAGYIKGRSADNLDVTEDMVRVAIWVGRMNGILEVR